MLTFLRQIWQAWFISTGLVYNSTGNIDNGRESDGKVFVSYSNDFVFKPYFSHGHTFNFSCKKISIWLFCLGFRLHCHFRLECAPQKNHQLFVSLLDSFLICRNPKFLASFKPTVMKGKWFKVNNPNYDGHRHPWENKHG